MECMVQGIVETQHVDALEILLRDLSGVPKEQLRIHKLFLKSGTNLGSAASAVCILCDLEQPLPAWTICYDRGSMRGTSAEQIMNSHVQNIMKIKANKNPLGLFYELGYTLNYEVLKVGFAFSFRRSGFPVTVSVTSEHKMLKLHATEEKEPVTPGIQFVEISAPATVDNYNEAVAAISSLCEYLHPIIRLAKGNVSAGVVTTAAEADGALDSPTKQ